MSVEIVTAEEFQALAHRVADLEARLAASMPPEPSPYVSVVEAAAFLRTSRGAVDDLLSAGRLPRYKVGRRTLVARADLDALVQTDPRPRAR